MTKVLDCANCGYPLQWDLGRLDCDCPLKRDLLNNSTLPPHTTSFLNDEEKRTLQMPLVPQPPWIECQVTMIVCMTKNRVIGDKGDIPWHLPKDMQRFRKLTMGKPILMGRKTYESIGRALPGRKNIILTRQEDFIAPGCIVVNKLHDVLVHTQDVVELMVIGGSSLYTKMLPACSRIYLTEIDTTLEGDTFFPVVEDSQWDVSDVEHVEPDGYHKWGFTFSLLTRR